MTGPPPGAAPPAGLPSSAVLSPGLDRLEARALLILAVSSRDPDVAPFVGPVHLGRCFVLATRQGPARLGYLSPLERDEAAATGLALLTPEELEVLRLSREIGEADGVLAAVVGRALELCGLARPGAGSAGPASAGAGGSVAASPRLAVAGHAGAGTALAVAARLAAAGWTAVPGNRLALLLRKAKDGAQLRDARRTAAGAATAMRRVAELLAAAGERGGELWLGGERLTVARLRLEVARTLAACELEQPEGNLVAPAEEGAVPHTTGTPARVLRPGESLVVDLFPRGRLFADCTRTFCVGRPPEALAAAHATVLAALGRARSKLQPARLAAGLRGWSVQDSVCALFADAGYPTPISHPGTTSGYVHGLGHGVGFELHELPSFRREAAEEEGTLAAGDLFTLEPGLYDPAAVWAVRLEDLVHLGEDGAESLTPLPYALDPAEWR
jgi:Xaa-Pro aminopeptidase